MKSFDLMILGGGPGGYSSAIAAAKSGLKVVLFEKGKLGGTCLNVGCIPTKYIIDKAAALEKTRGLTQKGMLEGTGNFNFAKLQAGKDEAVKKLVNGVAFLLKKSGVTVVEGEAQLISPHRAACNGEEYESENVIIATGSAPATIPVPGAGYALDSTGVLSLEQPPARMVVIGGGVIGLEMASAYRAFGTEVTVIEMLDSLLPTEQPEAARLLAMMLKKRGIKIRTGCRVERIERKSGGFAVLSAKNDTTYEDQTDVVLMAVGRKPNLSGIDAGKLGMSLDPKGFIEVNRKQQTNLKNVYAVGDVAGGYQLAHVAYAEGETAVSNILGHERETDLKAVPRCIYTMPCFAAVGMTSEQAKTEGMEPVLGTFNYSGNGMALAEDASGTVYVIMDKGSKRTVGVQIVGEGASELISLATLAVAGGITLSEWEDLIIAHPSLAEMVREAAMDAFGKAIHKI